jgi:hypothetical protein
MKPEPETSTLNSHPEPLDPKPVRWALPKLGVGERTEDVQGLEKKSPPLY